MPLVGAAGGRVSTLSGADSSDADLEKIVSNGRIHEELLAVLCAPWRAVLFAPCDLLDDSAQRLNELGARVLIMVSSAPPLLNHGIVQRFVIRASERRQIPPLELRSLPLETPRALASINGGTTEAPNIEGNRPRKQCIRETLHALAPSS